MNVTVGPKARQAVIRVKAVSDKRGGAFAAIVLTYPDGHRRTLDNAIPGAYGANDMGTFELDGLPSGVYTCTVYAVPYKAEDELFLPNGVRANRSFPVGEMVKKNVAASATFVIP